MERGQTARNRRSRSRSRSRDREVSRAGRGMRDRSRDRGETRRQSRSSSRSRSRSRSRDRSRRHADRKYHELELQHEKRPAPPRRIQPNHGILGSILRHNIRTNDRMDKEEVERATVKLKIIDPKTSRSAKLMSGHLSSAEAGLDVFSTPASAAHEAAIAAARTAATSGDVSLSSLSEYYGDKLLPGPSVCKDGVSKRSPSPDREVECPYNRAHKMPAQSLKHHITKCPNKPK